MFVLIFFLCFASEGYSEDGFGVLVKRTEKVLAKPEGASFWSTPVLQEVFPEFFKARKTVEFFFGREFYVPEMSTGESPTVRMIFNDMTNVDLPLSLAFPGAVVFVNRPLRHSLQSIKGFKMFAFILYGKCKALSRPFRSLWNENIYNVLGVCIDNGIVRLLLMNPFNGTSCNSFQITQVGVWNGTNSNIKANFVEKVFSAPLDLNGCWVRVSFFNRPPGYIEGEIPSGYEVDILREMFKKANGQIQSKGFDEKSDGSFFLREELSGNADIIGGMIYNPFLKLEETGVFCGLTIEMTWVTPRWKDFHLVDVTLAFLALPGRLMALLFLAYTLVVLFFFCVSFKEKPTKRTQFFNIISLIFNQPAHIPFLKTPTARLSFALWSFFSLIISCSYQAGLKTQLTLGETDIVISSLQDLIDSNLRIICKISYYYSHLKNLIKLKPEYSVLNDRILYLKDESDVKGILEHVAKHKDMALLEKVEVLEYVYTFLSSEVKAQLKIHYGVSERVVTPFVVQKKSYFYDFLMNSCASFSEAGIVRKIKLNYNWKAKLRKKMKKKTISKALTLGNMSHGFFILLFGLYYSSSVLLVEILYKYLIGRKRLRRKMAVSVGLGCFLLLVLIPISVDFTRKARGHHPHENFTLDMSEHTVGNDTWWKDFIN